MGSNKPKAKKDRELKLKYVCSLCLKEFKFEAALNQHQIDRHSSTA
jgi:hypothetical protein